MTIETILTIYGIGIPAWCFIMSFRNEDRVDLPYLASALIWPVMAIHVAGLLTRRIFP